MISLAIISQKGGVGKTTTAVNLAYSMARRGWSTLLADTDPQGSVGLSLSEQARKRPGYYDAANTGASALSFILPTRLPELQILTAGSAHSYFSPYQNGVNGPEAVRRVLKDVAGKNYDLVIIDTPAGMGGAAGDVLKVADFVLIPQQAEPLGVRSIPHVLHAIQHLRQEGSRIEVVGILLTMVQHDQRECQDVIRELRGIIPPSLLMKVVIPRDPVFLAASTAGVPVGLLRRNPPAAAHAFDQLAAEVEDKLRLKPTYNEHECTKLMD